MIVTPVAVDVPLHTDEHGRMLVGNTRVTLDSLIGFYRQGETAEDLHEGFPTVPLAHIYAVIAYYLANEAEVDAYLKAREEIAERVRHEWESRNPPPTKAELVARLEAKRQAGS